MDVVAFGEVYMSGRKCSLVLHATVFNYLNQFPVGGMSVDDAEFSNESF